MEMCDWCEGGACDLVFGNGISADIDRETGVMTVYGEEGELASRKVRYCPMCGRAVCGGEKRGMIDAEKLETEVRRRLFDNPHKDVKIRHNHKVEWETMLNLIYRMVER